MTDTNGKKLRISLRRRRKHRTEPGSSPGQITAPPESPKPILKLIHYSQAEFTEKEIPTVAELPPRNGSITWLNVDGLGDAEIIKEIGTRYNLHPLALEDVVSSYSQRPKFEDYDDSVFIVARMPIQQDGRCSSASTEQICFFLLDKTVVTFQEVPGGDPFEKVRERLRKSKGKIRSRGADYLIYALLDAIIDSYFPLLEEQGDNIELIEQEILDNPVPETLIRLHGLKQELILVRRSLWPLREVVNSLIRDASDCVTDETKLFLRDCYDHSSQLLEITDTYRDLCADLMDIYLSKVSNRTNDVVKFLTIISTIFIPLTFVVGVYGMNFNTESSPYNMPELKAYYGYPGVMLAMLLMSFSLILYFKKKKWI